MPKINVPVVDVNQQESPNRKHKDQRPSVVRVASAMAEGYPEDESSIQFTPRNAWLPQLTTDGLLEKRKERRDRFGYEVDFSDYKPPYQKHVFDRTIELEALEGAA